MDVPPARLECFLTIGIPVNSVRGLYKKHTAIRIIRDSCARPGIDVRHASTLPIRKVVTKSIRVVANSRNLMIRSSRRAVMHPLNVVIDTLCNAGTMLVFNSAIGGFIETASGRITATAVVDEDGCVPG